MVELGELEAHSAEFKKRNVRVAVISNDDQQTAQITQADYPSLLVVSDAEQNLAKAFQVLHPGAAPDGKDTNAPSTLIVDGSGTVKWFYRSEHFISRLAPEELIRALDGTLRNTPPL